MLMKVCTLQTASLVDCSCASHDSLAVEMLYISLLGREPPSHPDWQAFAFGFSLLYHNGFDFCKVCATAI